MCRCVPASNPRALSLRHQAWRWLYLVHRWIGIVTCLLFAMWFVSGLVMIYVPFPALTRAERLEGLTPIAWDQVRAQPAAVLAAERGPPRTLALEMRDRAPVWHVGGWDGAERLYSAVTGAPLGSVDATAARRIAGDFGHAGVAGVSRVVRDQWTVAGGFDRHRPLWKARLDGPGGRILYVSSTTGMVVLDTNARERFWNWLGSVPHWLYPTVLRQDNAAWRQVVLWVSGPCIVAAIAGIWIGLLRVRLGRRRFGGGRMIPYRGWMAWHHVAGLVGGLFLVGWIFSGWLSVDPGRLFAGPGIDRAARLAYADAGNAPPLAVDRLARIADGAKRVELSWFDGQPLLTIEGRGPAVTLDARTLAPARIDPAHIRAAAARLVPGAPIAAFDRLSAPDFYWYDVGAPPQLPIFRVKFADPAGTWAHIDPGTGAILRVLDRRDRIYRWAFDLLHKWDLNGLTLHRPAWDILLWFFSLLGIVTSITGIRIAWARLRRRPFRLTERRRRGWTARTR